MYIQICIQVVGVSRVFSVSCDVVCVYLRRGEHGTAVGMETQSHRGHRVWSKSRALRLYS